MPDIPGKLVTIYIGDGGAPEAFSKIAATQNDQITINNQPFEQNTKDSGGWRETFPGGVIKSATMTMRGVYEETADQDALLNLSMSTDDVSSNFIFNMGGTRQLRGRFSVDSFDYTGETQGGAQFSATFSSDGPVILEAKTV